MGAYSYRAYNAAGRITTGFLEAENLEMLENRLRAAGIWLLEPRKGSRASSGRTSTASSSGVRM